MKRRDFLKGAIAAGAVVAVPSLAVSNIIEEALFSGDLLSIDDALVLVNDISGELVFANDTHTHGKVFFVNRSSKVKGNGCLEKPFETIGTALDQCQQGSTLYIMPSEI
jgi:hypothetical protein